jgi:hypothetical protein
MLETSRLRLETRRRKPPEYLRRMLFYRREGLFFSILQFLVSSL